jgi:HK97 family phage portal protein
MGLFDGVASLLGYTPNRAIEPKIRDAVDQTMRDYSLAWPTPMLWGMFGGAGSSTGIPITPLSALQVSAVYGCVKRLSEDLAGLPFVVERLQDTHGWTVDLDHPLNNVLLQPNNWMTPFEFWRYMVVMLELRGNAIAVIKRGWDGSPEAFIPINWDRVSVLLSPQGFLFYNISHPQVGWGVTFHQDDVIHLRGLTVDGGYLGMTPIAVAQDVVGLALATQQHGAVLFRQGAQIAKVLKHPGKLGKEAAERIAQSIANTQGGVQNAYKTLVLEEGMDIASISMTNEDSQFLETRQFQVIEVCRMFGVPPHKIYDLSKANYQSLEQQDQAYLTESLKPRVTNMSQSVTAKSFYSDEIGRVRVRQDYSSLLQGDMKAQAEFYGSALNNGWMTVNEVRATRGMAPVKNGDGLRQPATTVPLGTVPHGGGTPGQPEKPGGIGSDMQPTPGGMAPVSTETADQAVL